MKAWLGIVLGVGAALAFAGCGVPSLNPLVDKGDGVIDDRIEGQWDFAPEAGDGSDKFVLGVEKSGEAYKVELTKNPGQPPKGDERSNWRMVATLTRIGGQLYADLERDPTEEGQLCTLDVHVPARVSLNGDVLGIAWVQERGLRAILNKEPKALAHAFQGQAGASDASILITAPTPDIRSFLEKHSKDPDLFSGESHWKKRATAKK